MGAKDFTDLASLAAILDPPGLKELQRQARQMSELVGAAGTYRQLESIRAAQSIFSDSSIKELQRQARQASQILKDCGIERRLEALGTIASTRAVFAPLLWTNASSLASTIERARLAFKQSQWDLSSSLAGLRPMLEEASRVRAAEMATIEEVRSMAAAYVGSVAEVTARLRALEWPVNFKIGGLQRDALADMSAALRAYEGVIKAIQKLPPPDDGMAPPAIRTTAETSFLPLAISESRPSESGLAARLAQGEGMRELTLGKLCLAQRLWSEAEYHCAKAAEWRLEGPEPHVGRGIALNALDRFEESVAAFELAEDDGADFSSRPDVRAVYEASLQHRRWDGQAAEDDKPKN